MIRLLIAFVVVDSMFLVVYKVARMRGNGEETSPKVRAAIGVLLLSSLVLLMEAFAGRQDLCKSMLILLLADLSFIVLLSPLWRIRRSLYIVNILAAVQLLSVAEEILYLFDMPCLTWTEIYLPGCLLLSFAGLGIFFVGLWLRFTDIRSLMNESAVIQTLEYGVESIYMTSYVAITLTSAIFAGAIRSRGLMAFAFILAAMELTALAVRMFQGNLMVLRHRHEQNIFESLKVSQVEACNGVKQDTYRELYDRIVEYFEKEEPFLNSNLTINDVVKVVFSNKSYISKSIGMFTGRNFRQFVNYYRIAYAVRQFRKNPNLNVSQLSTTSGFNSAVSFNMVFRHFMAENPSEWCRKERAKIQKKKK